MAEGLARALFGSHTLVRSAGSHPSRVDPRAIKVMAEIGIDISHHVSKSVDAVNPARFDTVITLCDGQICPVTLEPVHRLHWPLPDPVVEENPAAALARFRAVRDDLARRLKAFAAEHGQRP